MFMVQLQLVNTFAFVSVQCINKCGSTRSGKFGVRSTDYGMKLYIPRELNIKADRMIYNLDLARVFLVRVMMAMNS